MSDTVWHTETGRKALAWLRPAHPLISFGHPEESPFPFVMFLGGSEADTDRQFREQEEIRLKTLSVNYLIENKGTTNADTVRELSTGAHTGRSTGPTRSRSREVLEPSLPPHGRVGRTARAQLRGPLRVRPGGWSLPRRAQGRR